jgi:anthranilate synthase component 1
MMESPMPPAPNASPSLENFTTLAGAYDLIPVSRTVTADLETPVSAFLRVAADEPEAFLLESVEGGERIGRYTFIGIRPYRRITARGTSLTISEGDRTETRQGDIFAELKSALESTSIARLPGLPPFVAGAVGFFSYDVVRQIERLPTHAADELHAPDAHLMFFDEVLAFDHVAKAIHLIVTAGARASLVAISSTPDADSPNPDSPHPDSPAHAYADALTRLDRLQALLEAPLPRPARQAFDTPLTITPRTQPADFLAAVARVKDYIRAGDIFQCVLSQRFDCTPAVDPFSIYRALRIINPSPYMYFLRFPKQGLGIREQGLEGASAAGTKPNPYSLIPKPSLSHIVGSSPEMLVRISTRGTARKIEYRPIAGTRPRGVDEAADRAHEASLRADPKEVAEHIMLVDLGRNDVGRVSEFGSVKVKDLMFVERYSHVMHLVSAVEGTLREGLSPIDAFRACFPAGTLSGAPKIRALEIIDELEPTRRGVYGGAIVYADFSGNFDSCIAIRTLFMDGEEGHIQAGAGIVADSVPEHEHEECRNKAAAVVRAIERARQI